MKHLFKFFTLLSTLLLTCAGSGYSQSSTYSYTGAVQSYTVPPFVTSLGVDAKGGSGGGAYVKYLARRYSKCTLNTAAEYCWASYAKGNVCATSAASLSIYTQ